MLGLGHLPEIFLICLVGLLIFGPQRMIQMGSALGKAVRELREATKDMDWSSLLGASESATKTSATLSALSQFTQSLTNSVKGSNASPPTSAGVIPPTDQPVVESEPPVDGEESSSRAVADAEI